MARLSDDYLSTTAEVTRNLIGQHREAPTIFKHHGLYYLITSGCTGWDPNEAQYATAPSVFGPWEPCGNPCIGPDADKTFFAQSAFVLPLPQKSGAFVFMADRWKKQNLRDSRYVWLPIRFEGIKLLIEWQDEWDLSAFD
jgi:beta-xylosidase